MLLFNGLILRDELAKGQAASFEKLSGRRMSQLISEIWEGLCSAGLTEVMLYLPDHSAARCHWRDTAMIGGVRVALIADQERKIVRIVPVDTCAGIGVASPKGVDPTGHRSVVLNKIVNQFPQPPDAFAVIPEIAEAEHSAQHDQPAPEPTPPAAPAPPSAEMVQAPAEAASPTSARFGSMTRNLELKVPGPAITGQGVSRPGDRGWKRA